MSQPYELLYLIPTQISEEELSKFTQKIRKTIEKQSGKVHKDELWSKRKLAYPIKKHRQAYYWLVEFDAPREANKIITRELKLIPEIIRFIITDRLDYRPIRPIRETEKPEKIAKPEIRKTVKEPEENFVVR